MGDLRTCPRCGVGHARREEVEPCALCMPDWWAVGLGLSIQRFVRRSQVSALRTAIVERMQHSGLCSMAGRCVCDVDEAYRAVETLAAMAMEAHGDG